MERMQAPAGRQTQKHHSDPNGTDELGTRWSETARNEAINNGCSDPFMMRMPKVLRNFIGPTRG